METFEEWCESYDDFEMFVGVNRISHRGVAEYAWNHQQQKIKKLEAEKAKLVECVKLYVSCENIGHLVASLQVLEKSHQCLKDLGIGEKE